MTIEKTEQRLAGLQNALQAYEQDNPGKLLAILEDRNRPRRTRSICERLYTGDDSKIEVHPSWLEKNGVAIARAIMGQEEEMEGPNSAYLHESEITQMNNRPHSVKEGHWSSIAQSRKTKILLNLEKVESARDLSSRSSALLHQDSFYGSQY
jgi:hypothetical protein